MTNDLLRRVGSPYTLSYVQQIKLCLWRSWQRLKGDPSVTFTQVFANSIMALVIASVFYNLQPNTNSFFERGAVLFFAILMNAFGSALEVEFTLDTFDEANIFLDSYTLCTTLHC